MLTISSRYIGWRVCKMILLILLIVAVIQFVLGFVTELSHIGHGNYHFVTALEVLSLSLPMKLYGLFSVVAFLGTVLSLGSMVQQNELVVFRAAGMSLYRLLRVVLQAVIVLTLVVTVLCEWVAPAMDAQSVSIKQQALYHANELFHHYWFKDKEVRFVYVHHAKSEKELKRVSWLQLGYAGDDSVQAFANHAVRKGKDWLMPDMWVTKIGASKTAVHQHHDIELPLTVNIRSLQVARHAVDQDSVMELHQELQIRRRKGRPTGRYQVAFWSRILEPVSTLVLVMLGVPLVFTQMKRATGSSRLLIGIVIGFVFYVLNQLLAPFGVLFSWSPALVVFTPIILFFAISLVLMKRVSG